MNIALAACSVAFGLLIAACGGEKAPPPVTPAATATASAAPTATASAEAPEAPKKNRADLLETKNSHGPDKMPEVRCDAPGNDQKVSGYYAQDYKVRYKVTGWSGLPEGSYLQFILDNVPYRPITDPAEKLTLKDLAGGTISEGEHVLAIYVARKNREIIKAAGALVVRRFFVGKKTPSDWDATRDPIMVIGPPHGSYEGEGAQEIVGDFFVMNATLSDNDYSIKMTLKGPGIEPIDRYVTEWRPVAVLFASEGDYTLTAELQDSKAGTVKAPWNPTERKFTVKKGSSE